eukprot:scaffold36407_cov26-Prasinocladus_malaysianus.AAC.1
MPRLSLTSQHIFTQNWCQHQTGKCCDGFRMDNAICTLFLCCRRCFDCERSVREAIALQMQEKVETVAVSPCLCSKQWVSAIELPHLRGHVDSLITKEGYDRHH